MKRLLIAIGVGRTVVRTAGLCAEEEPGRRHGLGGCRQARSAHRVDDAGQGPAQLDVQRPRPDHARHRSAPSSSSPISPRAGRRTPAGTEWTFKLRKGVQCHHGYGEFTADDAVYSLKRASNKATSSFSSDFSAVDKVEALDKYTVKITLKNPVAEPPRATSPTVNGGNHGLQEGRRGDGRELRQEADRHRALHVRRVPAAAVREARRQQAVFPRRAEARGDHRIATSRPTRAAISPSSRASST